MIESVVILSVYARTSEIRLNKWEKRAKRDLCQTGGNILLKCGQTQSNSPY